MTVRRVEAPAPPVKVQLTVRTGGDTAESALGDAIFLEPIPGKYEDVEARGVFPKDGRMRFKASEMREALDLVEELR